jgi:hypothetical protein
MTRPDEIAALADELERDALHDGHSSDAWVNHCVRVHKAVAALRLSATSPGDAVRALEELLRCSNAIVGADRQDPDAAEAFDMFDSARGNARNVLSASNRPAALGGAFYGPNRNGVMREATQHLPRYREGSSGSHQAIPSRRPPTSGIITSAGQTKARAALEQSKEK